MCGGNFSSRAPPEAVTTAEEEHHHFLTMASKETGRNNVETNPADVKDGERELITHQLSPTNPSTWDRILGAVVITSILGCMALGPLLPVLLIVSAIMYRNTISLVATLAALLLASMMFARHAPLWCRWHLQSAGYFTKGVYLHMEQRSVRAMTRAAGSMWCMHPHGTSLGFGFSLNGAVRFRANNDARFVPPEMVQNISQERLRNTNGVMAPILFYIPLIRNMLLAFGCCTPATKKAMKALFEKGVDFGILPGGMEEVALNTHGQDRVYLSKRAGFIKYALQYGYLVQPAYTFGESDLYQSMTTGASLRLWAQEHFGFIIPIFWGPYAVMPWLPRSDVALHTVLGAPLQLPHIAEPTVEQVNKYHHLYIDALTELFETHKGQFGYGDRKLQVL